ncbi:MAG: polyprenyl synthetase family protein [Nitrospirae bacterium]|nr:MAG: polyprenyl synthetase family protein [Nitrospirota bacterium]
MERPVRSLREAREIREVLGAIQTELAEVERFFERELGAALPMVREVAGWILGGGGKRIRPALVLLISRMLDYEGERAVRYAAVVELIHTATLIHDDIIDESELRRGRPTANRRWGNQPAVLVGDWLYTRTMDLCLELGDVEVMRLLTGATLKMIEGEILADQVRGRIDLDEGTYMEITRRKTAELFAAACALPALFQPSTLHLTGQLATFGRSLGLCFQLIDDVLDYTASEEQLGKPALADLREGRVTLPLILLLPRLDGRRREAIARVAEEGEFGPISAGELLELVRTSGVLDEVRRRAAGFARRAVAQLEEFGGRPEAAALARAADLLLERRS